MRGHVFSKKETLEKLLWMRAGGTTLTEIAEHFGVDHTTIIYHCQKNKKTLEQMKKRKAELRLILEEPINPGKDYKEYLKDSGSGFRPPTFPPSDSRVPLPPRSTPQT